MERVVKHDEDELMSAIERAKRDCMSGRHR